MAKNRRLNLAVSVSLLAAALLLAVILLTRRPTAHTTPERVTATDTIMASATDTINNNTSSKSKKGKSKAKRKRRGQTISTPPVTPASPLDRVVNTTND